MNGLLLQIAKNKLKSGMKKDPFIMQVLMAAQAYIEEGEKMHGQRPKLLLDIAKDGKACRLFVVRIEPLAGEKTLCNLNVDATFDLDLPQQEKGNG